MNGIEVSQSLLVDHCQLRIQPDYAVSAALMALCPVGAAFTIFAFVELFGSSILAALYRCGS